MVQLAQKVIQKGCSIHMKTENNNLIYVDFSQPIQPEKLVRQNNKLRASAQLTVPSEIQNIESYERHDVDPIKDTHTLKSISDYLISKGRYRDNMLFILGINFGLRVSDLRLLTFNHLLEVKNQQLVFKEYFPIIELKTKKTRRKKINRVVTINSAVMDAVELFLNHNSKTLNDYLFTGDNSNRSKNLGKPLTREYIYSILKGLETECNLTEKVGTHTLRKTFGYHQMAMSNFSNDKLLLLQEMFGHSSPSITLRYIGLTQDIILASCKKLNLGTDYSYVVNSNLEAINLFQSLA